MVYSIDPWQDRFRTPAPADLRKGLEAEAVEAFDLVRGYLLKLDGVAESLGWYGPSWCWSLEYRVDGLDEPLAILIPSPHDLQLAMPLDSAFLEQLPIRRMKRAIRDGLELAQAPFDTHWAIWSLQPAHVLEDLKDLVDRRMKFVAASRSN